MRIVYTCAMLDKLFPKVRQSTLGGKFHHLCVVGLNTSELLAAGSDSPISGDNWQDIADEQTRRRLALVFFAPRELDGQPTQPAHLLADDATDPESITLIEQSLGKMPLLDFCRMPPAEPGILNFIVAADVIFHWDSNDNYITPTDKLTWIKDVQRIVKTYPKNTEAKVYTVWDPEKIGDLGLPVEHLRHVPMFDETWVNIPTVQEKLGSHVLAGSIFLAILAWVGLHMQASQMDRLDEKIRITEQQIPREGNFRSLSRFMREQQQFMRYRETLPWIVQDVAHAMQQINMQAESLEIENPNPTEPTDIFIARVEAEKDAYQGWLQEEPVAKNLLLASTAMSAIRKPPGNTFRLEGLLDMRTIQKNVVDALEAKQAAELAEAGQTNAEAPAQ